jgi:hypothetical protein
MDDRRFLDAEPLFTEAEGDIIGSTAETPIARTER